MNRLSDLFLKLVNTGDFVIMAQLYEDRHCQFVLYDTSAYECDPHAAYLNGILLLMSHQTLFRKFRGLPSEIQTKIFELVPPAYVQERGVSLMGRSDWNFVTRSMPLYHTCSMARRVAQQRFGSWREFLSAPSFDPLEHATIGHLTLSTLESRPKPRVSRLRAEPKYCRFMPDMAFIRALELNVWAGWKGHLRTIPQVIKHLAWLEHISVRILEEGQSTDVIPFPVTPLREHLIWFPKEATMYAEDLEGAICRAISEGLSENRRLRSLPRGWIVDVHTRQCSLRRPSELVTSLGNNLLWC